MPVQRSPNSAQGQGKGIRGRGGAVPRSGSRQAGNEDTEPGSPAATTADRGKKKATAANRGAPRAVRSTRNTKNSTGEAEEAAGFQTPARDGRDPTDVADLIANNPGPLAEEVRRLVNLMPGTPAGQEGAGRPVSPAPDAGEDQQQPPRPAPENPNPPGQPGEGPGATPRQRQRERVAADLIAAKKLFRTVNDFEGTVETAVTERKYDQLDELHAQQYRLETENATVCLVNSSLATVRRFPNEAAELTKVYQNNVTILEYTRRILREATHQNGQRTGDQRPLEERSISGSPRNQQTPGRPRTPVPPPMRTDGIDPLLTGEIPPQERARLLASVATDRRIPPVVELEPPANRSPRNRAGREQIISPPNRNAGLPRRIPDEIRVENPPRSQSQRRASGSPGRQRAGEANRSRESPDKFGDYNPNPGNNRTGSLFPRGGMTGGEYMGFAAFYQSLPEGWDTAPNLNEPVDFNQYSMMQRAGLMPSFNGTVEGYPSFKAHFRLAVHQVALPIFAKFMALKAALEKAIELQSFLNTLEPGTTGYALLLNELEDRFGGRERQLHRHASNIRFLPVATEDHHKHLQGFVDTVQAYHACLGSRAAVEIESYNHFNTIYYKLDRNLRMKYRTYCRTMGLSAAREGSAANLLAWVKNVILAPLRMETHRLKPDDRGKPAPGLPRGEFKKPFQRGPPGRAMVADQGPECVLCTGNDKAHNLDKCPTFKQKAVHDRKALTFQLRRCFICLQSGHRASQCNGKKCHCNQRHHPLLCTREQQALHVQEQPPGLQDLIPAENDLAATAGYVAKLHYVSHHPTYQPPPEIIAQQHWEEKSFILKVLEGETSQKAISLRYVALVIRNPQNNRWTRTVALLDDGANISLISERLMDKLGIQAERKPIHIGGIGGRSVTHNSGAAHVALEHLNGRIRYNVRMSSLPDPVGGLTMTDWASLSQQWEHLRDIPFHPLPADPTVQLLIGNDLNFLHRSLHEVHARHNREAPIARLTTFGWTATGPYSPPLNIVQVHTSCRTALTHIEMDGPLIVNSDDRSALKLLATTVAQLESGHYQAPVLWRGLARPPYNAMHALRDWWRTWQSLKTKPDIYQRYDEVVQGWISKRYVRQVPMHEQRPLQCYHLPHFPVVREDHLSTKIRIVMNAKASFLGQPSLNDCVLPGPAIMNDLADVLFNFRRFRYGVSGDIQEMFLRICMMPEDRPFHRFYYSPLGSDIIHEFEALVHQFGNRGSPFIAMYVVLNHAWLHREEYPLAYRIVKDYSIVDDCMTSLPYLADAINAVHQLVGLFQLCNMNIHKWAVSDPQILQDGVITQTTEPKYFTEHTENATTTLGLVWHTDDTLGFQVPKNPVDTFTKRSALSLNNTLFDPHGLLLPFRMLGRFLYKDICLQKPPIAWDQELEPKMASEWRKWEDQLADFAEFKVPRWLGLEEFQQMHVFGDASGQAFGACAYVVTTKNTSLVGAKAHLQRSHTQTIPRLELDAALEAMRLGQKLAKSMEIDPTKIHYWSDSVNTLHWIKNPARQLEDYVLRRAYTIREETSPYQWHHVATNFNPADLLTRGVTSKNLLGCDLWWHGPKFITTGAWPNPMVQVQDYVSLPKQSEINNLLRIFAGHQVPDPLANASSFLQGIRTLQVLLKALKVARPDSKYAFSAWLKYEQRAWFQDQLAKVSQGNSIMWQGVKIFVLNQMLVMTGRTDQPPRPLLHPQSRLAQMWVVHMHENVLQHCGGHRTLTAACRQQVWLWQGSSLFRQVSRNCVKCRRVLPRPRAQQMAPLPPARYALQPMTVFTEVSLDYAGPWYTKQGRGKVRQPRFLLLVCCMASRACALEFTYSETTDSTLMALQRFASRYRLPNSIYSDNAPSLVAAAKIINDWSGEQGNLPVHPDWRDIHWTFSHPRAPHSNGVTESLIKSAKHSIKKILRDDTTTDDILRTVFAFAEDILNQRPIALVNNSPQDLETLTPALLLGRAKGNIAPGPASTSKLLSNWRLANQMALKFWNQFRLEVVPELEKSKQMVGGRSRPCGWRRSCRP